MVGLWELLVIFLIVIVLFGSSKIEKLGPSLGKAIRGFKKGMNGEDETAASEESKKTTPDKTP